jgi:hypothetical protein
MTRTTESPALRTEVRPEVVAVCPVWTVWLVERGGVDALLQGDGITLDEFLQGRALGGFRAGPGSDPRVDDGVRRGLLRLRAGHVHERRGNEYRVPRHQVTPANPTDREVWSEGTKGNPRCVYCAVE